MGNNALQHIWWGIKMFKWRTQILKLEGLFHVMEGEKYYDYNDQGRQKRLIFLLMSLCKRRVVVRYVCRQWAIISASTVVTVMLCPKMCQCSTDHWHKRLLTYKNYRKIGRSHNCLTFIMGIHISSKAVLICKRDSGVGVGYVDLISVKTWARLAFCNISINWHANIA